MLSSFSWYPCKRCDFVHISVKIFAFLMQNQYLEKCCYEFILQYLECLIENFEHFWFQISNLSVYPVNTSSEKFVHLWCKIKHFDFYIFPHVVNIISEQSFWNVSLKILTISFLKSASCLCALRYVQVKKSCISGAKAIFLSPTFFPQLWAYARHQLSICTLNTYTSAYTRFSCAYARFQLSMCVLQLSTCTLPVEHIRVYLWNLEIRKLCISGTKSLQSPFAWLCPFPV